jgi:hypothetical protein
MMNFAAAITIPVTNAATQENSTKSMSMAMVRSPLLTPQNGAAVHLLARAGPAFGRRIQIGKPPKGDS